LFYRFGALALTAALAVGFGQGANDDERRVASPNGLVEFRIGRAPPEKDGNYYRLAYEIRVAGKPLIARSYLSLDLLNIEPLLGEKDGLIGSKTGAGPGYNSLLAEYMQEGSLGDLIDIEARVYDDGVAFRYVLPKSTPLLDLNISNEVTEFRFAAGKEALRGLHWGDAVKLPFVTQMPDRTWIAISEVRPADFPAASLAWLDENTLVTRLPPKPNDSEVAYTGHTPFTGPWRVIVFGKLDPPWLKSLVR
jgi:hypothetical protein